MKKLSFVITILVCISSLYGCNKSSRNVDEEFNFSKEDFVIIEEIDTHGGFHGDGSYYLTLDCSKNQEKVIEIVEDWNSFPLSENLHKAIYEKHYGIVDEKKLPKIENGYYKFLDRHREVSNEEISPFDDSNLFNRYSYNYTVAIYNLDTQTMYYFEYDT